MIFLFQGDRARGRSARSCMALVACTERFKTDKKVLVMSLKNNMPGNNLEDFLEEDVSTDSAGKDISYVTDAAYRDDGIDAVIRRAESGILKKDQFDNCVTPLLNVDHGLDLLRTSKETTFESSLSRKWGSIEKALKIADSLYDYVFVYTSTENEDLVDKLNQMATKVVFVVRQGRKVAEPKVNEKIRQKACVLVSDYEPESSWNEKHMRRMYNTNNVFTFPHNVKFGDIKEHGKIIKFAAANVNITQSDYNFELIKEVKHLVSFLDGQKTETVHRMVQDIDYQPLKKPERAIVLEDHPTEVTTEETETKGGLFKKKEHFFTNFFGRGKKQDIHSSPSVTVSEKDEKTSESEDNGVENKSDHMSGMPELAHEFEHITDNDAAEIDDSFISGFDDGIAEPETENGFIDNDIPGIKGSFLQEHDDYRVSHTDDHDADNNELPDDAFEDDFTDSFDDDSSEINDKFDDFDNSEYETDESIETEYTSSDEKSDLDIDTDWMSELVIDDTPEEPEGPREFTEDLMFTLGTDPF